MLWELQIGGTSKRRLASLVGFTAVLMWSLLAFLTAATGRVAPFQLTAIAFAVGGALGLAWLGARGRWRDLRQPWQAWLLGVGGLFGYHFFYFTALRNAPPVEASLIAFLWSLLIVVLSALLPGERVRWFHVAGAALGLAGTVLVVTRGEGSPSIPSSCPATPRRLCAPSPGRPTRSCRGALPRCRPARLPASAWRRRHSARWHTSFSRRPSGRHREANGLPSSGDRRRDGAHRRRGGARC